MDGGRNSMQLSDTSKFLDYICKSQGPAGPEVYKLTAFCFGFASTLNLSNKKKHLKVRQEPDACVRCVCIPKRVLHIPFRMASVCLFYQMRENR